jgi:SAM-dependent methyltransferase
MMSSYFDSYSESYKSILAESTGESLDNANYFACQKVQHLTRACKPSESSFTILDYGCGVGLSLQPLIQVYPQANVYAADPSTRSLEIASQEHHGYGINFIPVDQLSSDTFQDFFDLIYVSCVFHHIPAESHVKTLEFLRRLCSPSGMIAIFEHNPLNPITRKIVRNCPFDEGVTLIRAHSWKHLLKESGWKAPEKRYISFIPSKYQNLRSIEPFLYWCPLGAQYFIVSQPA